MTWPIYAMQQTWNNGSTVFHAIKMDITDTASDAASRFLSFQISATDKFYVKKDGGLVSAGQLQVGQSSGIDTSWYNKIDASSATSSQNACQITKAYDNTNARFYLFDRVGGVTSSDTGAGSFWRGVQFSPPTNLLDPVGGGNIFPRTAMYLEYNATTPTTNRSFNIDTGNDTATSRHWVNIRNNGVDIFRVDGTAASVSTGIKITGAATNGGGFITVMGGGTNENLALDSKGGGWVTLNQNGGTGRIQCGRDTHIVGPRPWADVMAYGAQGDGSTDDTTAIQNAINALPVTGGYVFFPPTTSFYRITATLTVGDGSASAGSTRWGVVLMGAGTVREEFFGSDDPVNKSASTIRWQGSAGGTMVQINGPLAGWGLKNLALDGYNNGSNPAGRCLKNISGSVGDCENLHLWGATVRVLETNCVGTFSGSNETASATFNTFRNTYIRTNPSSTGVIALALDGSSAQDSYCNLFINTFVVIPSGRTDHVAVYLGATDTNEFYVFRVQADDNNTGIKFDYTNALSADFPNTCQFRDVDLSFGGSNQYVNVGTPNSTIEPHMFFGVSRNNGGIYPNVNGTSNVSTYGHTLGFFPAISIDSRAGQFFSCRTAAEANIVLATAAGANANDAGIFFWKTRASNPATSTILSSGDIIGSQWYAGADGTTVPGSSKPSGGILAVVDGTPAATSVPIRLDFQTGSWNYGTVNFSIGSNGQIKHKGFLLHEVRNLSSNHTLASATATSVTDLKFASLAAGTYVVTYYLNVQSSATGTGIGTGVNFTGTLSQIVTTRREATTATSAATGVIDDISNTLTGQYMEARATKNLTTTSPDMVNTGFATANSSCLLIIETLFTVTVAGDLELWHSSETANNTSILANSVAILNQFA